MGSRFSDRIVLVVGASEPIGLATVRLFHEEGAIVRGLDLDPVRCHEARAELRAVGVDAEIDASAVTDPAALARVVTEIEEIHGRIDTLVYAATAMDQGGTGVASLALGEWQRIVDVHLTGAILCVQAVLPLLRRSAAGSIVIQASVDGHVGNPQVPAYSITKGGQVIMTHVLAAELAPENIRVNCVAIAGIPIHPGSLSATFRANTMAQTPLKRSGRAVDVAQAIAFLASEDSAYITGTSLYVDGGRLAVTPGTLDSP